MYYSDTTKHIKPFISCYATRSTRTIIILSYNIYIHIHIYIYIYTDLWYSYFHFNLFTSSYCSRRHHMLSLKFKIIAFSSVTANISYVRLHIRVSASFWTIVCRRRITSGVFSADVMRYNGPLSCRIVNDINYNSHTWYNDFFRWMTETLIAIKVNV